MQVLPPPNEWLSGSQTILALPATLGPENFGCLRVSPL